MNESVEKVLRLEEYRCRRCHRLFYAESGDRGGLEWDFGCPYGCDDNGEHIRDIGTEIMEMRGEQNGTRMPLV